MTVTTIAVAADHAGFALKERLKEALVARGAAVVDLGTMSEESVDYPDNAHALADALADGRAERGIAVCGTGIGISIALNRNPGVRAALCHDAFTAGMARKHNDANVLALGAKVVDEATALACLETFLTTEFEGGRHARRLGKLNRAEETPA